MFQIGIERKVDVCKFIVLILSLYALFTQQYLLGAIGLFMAISFIIKLRE